MITVSTQSLPSRGYLYEAETLTIRPMGIAELMLISSAIETGDDSDFVRAIQGTTDLQQPLTVGDFYYVAALQRIISYKKAPMTWEWTCSGDVLNVQTEDEAVLGVLEARNFQQVSPGTHALYKVTEEQLAEVEQNLRPLAGKFSGQLVNCGHNNSVIIDKDLLDANLIHLDSKPELPDGYSFPTSAYLGEFQRLYASESLRKLLPLVMWLDNSYGSTLEDRINTLRGREDALDILDVAGQLDIKYQHGYNRDLLCAPCQVCGAQTNRQRLIIAARSFYRK